jgi:hypothetical protein
LSQIEEAVQMRLGLLSKCQPSRNEQNLLKIRETEEKVAGEEDECKVGGLGKETKEILQDKRVEDMVDEVVAIKGDGKVRNI